MGQNIVLVQANTAVFVEIILFSLAYFSPLQPVPAYFSLCQPIPTSSSLFQPIQPLLAYSSLFQSRHLPHPHPDQPYVIKYLIICPLLEKGGMTWTSQAA